jgi:3-oxoacyl-[acyl-carrier-protein] synthase II
MVEARAIATALGDAVDGVVVSGTKSMTGHLLGGAGAVESVAAILALHDGVAPPTINLDDPEDDLAVEIALKPTDLHPRSDEPMAVINNSFGFGGHNVTLVFTAA